MLCRSGLLMKESRTHRRGGSAGSFNPGLAAFFAGLLLAAATVLSACNCEETTIFPVDPVVHQQLVDRYGSDGLPLRECEQICATRRIIAAAEEDVSDGGLDASAADSGDAGEGGAPSASAVRPADPVTMQAVTECHLTTINWEIPAVSCTGDCW